VGDDANVRDDPSTNGGQSATTATLQDATSLWPPLPDNVDVAEDVDIAAEDPCYVPEPVNAGNDRNSHRRCVATRQDGTRCNGRAMHHHLTCPLHTGAMRSEDGAKAKWTRRREREARAERALSLQKLGTRAVVAEALASEAANVERAVRLLCQSAGGGDLAAAKALIPWLNQALGTPTERVEHRPPRTIEEIRAMDPEELRRLVAEGRAERLQRLESERLGKGNGGGGVAG
jgi:hypothetical protein